MFVVVQVEFAYLPVVRSQNSSAIRVGTLMSMQSARTLASAQRLVRGGNVVIDENMSSKAEYAS